MSIGNKAMVKHVLKAQSITILLWKNGAEDAFLKCKKRFFSFVTSQMYGNMSIIWKQLIQTH